MVCIQTHDHTAIFTYLSTLKPRHPRIVVLFFCFVLDSAFAELAHFAQCPLLFLCEARECRIMVLLQEDDSNDPLQDTSLVDERLSR